MLALQAKAKTRVLFLEAISCKQERWESRKAWEEASVETGRPSSLLEYSRREVMMMID